MLLIYACQDDCNGNKLHHFAFSFVFISLFAYGAVARLLRGGYVVTVLQ